MQSKRVRFEDEDKASKQDDDAEDRLAEAKIGLSDDKQDGAQDDSIVEANINISSEKQGNMLI